MNPWIFTPGYPRILTLRQLARYFHRVILNDGETQIDHRVYKVRANNLIGFFKT